ncbi:hypothetical protein E4U42_005564 [Claviceps africana]|uniref:Nudix hydrolase domain-containing protein n=1 Tax=Claviceps africana TaxID=83212 RepID=A0A8K0JHJ2_9HYPO|nr:hypothetical protein E4U42_005564 [Claviceps africana]
MASLSAFSIPPAEYIRRNNLPWHVIATSALLLHPHPPRILLVRRAPHDSWPLHWELPGGAVDEDESILDGLARELAEETALTARDVRRVVPRPHVFWNSSRTKLVGRFVFEVGVGGGGVGGGGGDTPPVVLDPAEHCEFVWADEHLVRSGRLVLTGPELRDVLLEAFRRARGAA